MVGNKINSVFILTSEPFPFGMAATNRIISLCKGFIANGINGEVICMNRSEKRDEIINHESHGIYEGIKYQYLFKSNVISKHKIRRGIDYFINPFLVFIFCLKKIKKDTFIIYYSPSTLPALFARFACLIKGSLVFKEETEHPFMRLKKRNKLVKYLFLKFHYNIFNGIFVITNNLATYFRNELKIKKPIIIVPMIVDVDRFKNYFTNRTNAIVFSGMLDERKEGVGLLIQAFAKVLDRNPEYSLNLYGRPFPKQQGEIYRKMLTDLKITDKVFIHDYKNREEITGILLNADILTFTRPPSLQATFGFSTKLGEYLATGKPVISTITGETGKFLIDRENAFICEPTVESIYDKICEIIDDYNKALVIGARGKECVLKNFNNIIETKNIINKISYQEE